MLSAYGFYALYVPTKLHFTTDYNILKYERRTKSISVENFEKRKDRSEFEKWARICQTKERASGVCLANFAYSNDNWLYEPKEEAIETYHQWRKVRNSITKLFEDDNLLLSSYVEKGEVSSWSDFIQPTKRGNKPPLLQLLGANKVHRESVCIFNRLGDDFISSWMETYSKDPLIHQMIHRLKKYEPFCVKLCPTASDIFKELTF